VTQRASGTQGTADAGLRQKDRARVVKVSAMGYMPRCGTFRNSFHEKYFGILASFKTLLYTNKKCFSIMGSVETQHEEKRSDYRRIYSRNDCNSNKTFTAIGCGFFANGNHGACHNHFT
jgi:hypothetical protein